MARPRTSRGFTLVELLVVITIIGMLVSLLLPAIQAAREAGRRNTCQNNMRQAALGLIQFSEVKKGFPGYVNVVPKNGAVGGFIRTSWVVPILPALERNDLFQNWQNPAIPYNAMNRELFVSPLSILVCPSNANPDLGDNPLSFVVNTGRAATANETSTVDAMSNPVPAGTTYVDEDSNSGVFFNHSKWDGTANTVPVQFTGGKKVNADFLSTNDGTSYTLMMSENLQAVNWANDAVAGGNVMWQNDLTVRGHTGMVWFLTGNFNNDGPPTQAPTGAYLPLYNEDAMNINDGSQVINPGSYNLLYPAESMSQNQWTHGGVAFARPSSNHSGGVNSAFCDGHMRYIADSIEYRVYTQLMTPNQKAVNITPTSMPTTVQQAGWRYTLNEADY